MRPASAMAVVGQRARSCCLRGRSGAEARRASRTCASARSSWPGRKHKFLRHLPKSVSLTLVDVREPDPHAGTEPLHWRLLTTHAVADCRRGLAHRRMVQAALADRAVLPRPQDPGLPARRQPDRHRRRGSSSSSPSPPRRRSSPSSSCRRATAAATARPACLQCQRGRRARRPQSQSRRPRANGCRNPHPPDSLAWAAWIIGRLGGWDGYPSSKPPGPITIKHGLEYFHAVAVGWSLRDVCMP